MTRIPIACTLTSNDMTNRIEEWREFLNDQVAEAIRTTTSIRLRIHNDNDVVLRAIELCREEKACCQFFDFQIELLADAIWLNIGAPIDASPILDELFALRKP